MNTKRRNFLRLLPLAPLAVLTMTVEGEEAIRHETVIEGEKQYVFHFPNLKNCTSEQLTEFSTALEKKGYKNPVVLGGEATANMALYEVQPLITKKKESNS